MTFYKSILIFYVTAAIIIQYADVSVWISILYLNMFRQNIFLMPIFPFTPQRYQFNQFADVKFTICINKYKLVKACCKINKILCNLNGTNLFMLR